MFVMLSGDLPSNMPLLHPRVFHSIATHPIATHPGGPPNTKAPELSTDQTDQMLSVDLPCRHSSQSKADKVVPEFDLSATMERAHVWAGVSDEVL